MTQAQEAMLPPRTVLEECVRAATLAPSIYNTQPWRFRLRPGAVEVFADTVRILPAVDPDGREMHISLGAAVLNIEVMLQAHGYCPNVTLLPDPARPDLVARVEAEGQMSPTLVDLVRVAALTRRRTTREPFTDRPLHESLVDSLTDAARLEGATFRVLDGSDSQALLALVRTADQGLRRDPAYRNEVARWTTDYPNRQDGVLPDSFGPLSADAALPVRDFGAYQPWLDREPEQYETNPTIAVLATAGDGEEDWLRAGMALQRVLLDATIAGVSASFLTQPLEVPHLRRLYDERWPHVATQMVFRLGYARQPGAATTPPRPV
ncbi:MAG TPA: nitroreductase family protein, partial [Nocardioidaceae bacterium]|nr:nitroreductase family protein [Nocardioidaceae bacterium]